MSTAVEITSRDAVTLSFPPCWFDAPAERTPQFFPTFTSVSVALQSALRAALPEICLSGLDAFEDTRMVYPLLLYASSRPFPGQPRTDFTYDILNQSIMRRFFFSVRQNLPKMLGEIAARLRTSGMDSIARHYRPDHAADVIATVDRLKICRRRLEALLVAETWMVNDLVSFAGSRALPERAKAKLAARVAHQWHSRLQGAWARYDFTALGPGLVAAVSRTLEECIREQVPPFAGLVAGSPSSEVAA